MSKRSFCFFRSTHVTQRLVLRLRLGDLLRWMVALNSTVLSDDQGLKHFNHDRDVVA